MPLNKLAPHVAQLAGFGLIILTTPGLDFAKSSIKSLPFESAAQLVNAFDEGAAQARAALKNTPGGSLDPAWKLINPKSPNADDIRKALNQMS